MANSAFNPNSAGKTTVPVTSITSADTPYTITSSDVVIIVALIARANTGTPSLKANLAFIEGG
jgi:hypothetical protein